MTDALADSRVQKWPIVAVQSCTMEPVDSLTGEEIRRAREARRMTQQQLADALSVGLRTIGRWERNEAVPRSAIGALRDVLDLNGGERTDSDSDGPALRKASPAQLLAELARRMEIAETSTYRPAERPADLPTGRYRMPKDRAPSARADRRREQGRRGREQTQ